MQLVNMNNNTEIYDIHQAAPLMGWLDLGVFSAMLGASAIIGCYFGCCSGYKQNAREYLMAGKSLGIVPVSLSLVASFISGITVLGVPSEIYRYGTQYWAVLISGFLVAITCATIYVPIYIKLQLNSCYEYLELRFNKRVRRIASLLFVISQILNIPIVIYVPALAFSQVTGINVHLITPITCLVCIFYTTLGGLRAVVWTDALQTVLMFAATIAVLVLGAEKLGGWSEIWQHNERGQRLEFFNLDPDPLQRHTFWTVLFGTYSLDVARCAVNQGMVQRFLAVPNLRHAHWTLLWFAIGFAAIKFISIITGLLIFAAYDGCDPLSTKRVNRPDQLLPLYVLDVAGHIPGLSGLFVAGVFSAALSSMSTGLNALSGVLVEDLCAGWLPRWPSKGAWLRLAASISGGLCVCLVFVVERLGGVLQVTLSLGGITSGTMLGIFTLGMFFPRATSKGALTGAIVSLLTVGFLVLGAQSAIASGTLKHKTLPLSVEQCAANFTLPAINNEDTSTSNLVWPIFRLSYLYYSLVGSSLVILVGNVASYIFADHPATPHHEDLFCPLVHSFLPDSARIPKQENKPLFTMKPQ